ncbi:hypothetical protein C7387_2481 [Yokenella regensburgei]|uniref:Uncharacterized protein n=1 Tax=Yokenella regensburgei TaxID=158877 RepID=A0ABX9RWB8_9ENTR|nr:hypothetical protein [Yokenella regensburgei]RKR54325.1 hypothetical protein C7387_2481 [Yokenella regensburgei]VFS12773.1 Uncharacterised protein [Yokenella regensburgei]
MTTLTHDLRYFAQYFTSVRHAENPGKFSWLYLSPQERIERLEELLSPLSKDALSRH